MATYLIKRFLQTLLVLLGVLVMTFTLVHLIPGDPVVVMLGLTFAGLVLWRRGRLASANLFQRFCMLASPLGFVAVLAGWVTTEVGRQPWVVYGLLRTRDAVTPSLSANDVLISLLVYVVAYVFIFGAFGLPALGVLGLVVTRRVAAEGIHQPDDLRHSRVGDDHDGEEHGEVEPRVAPGPPVRARPGHRP